MAVTSLRMVARLRSGTELTVRKWMLQGMECLKVSLHKKEINAKDNIAVVLEDRGRQRNSGENRAMRGVPRAGRFSFKNGNVGSMNDGGALGVKWSDRTVVDEST